MSHCLAWKAYSSLENAAGLGPPFSIALSVIHHASMDGHDRNDSTAEAGSWTTDAKLNINTLYNHTTSLSSYAFYPQNLSWLEQS